MQAYEGWDVRSDHGTCHTTCYREYCENGEGEEYHGLPSKDITKLGINDQKPCCRWSDIVELWEVNCEYRCT